MFPEFPYPDYSVTQGKAGDIIRFYVMAFGIAWFVWIPLALSSKGWLKINIPTSVAWLAGLAPIFAGSFMAHREKGSTGIKELIARCFMWRFSIGWYLVTLLLPVSNILLDLLAYRLMGGSIVGLSVREWPLHYLAVLPFLIPLSLFEEAGWRGYASPRLLYLLGRGLGSLVLGLLWGIWHIPYYLIRGVSIFADFSLPSLLLALFFFVLGTAAFETLMTWVFCHTRGSLLFACMFHASNNAFANLSFVPTAKEGQGWIFVSSAVVCWLLALAILRAERQLQIR